MQVFLKLVYNLLALPLLFIYSKLMSLMNDKIKQREELANNYLDIPIKKNKRILIHASSMGEYEQVKYLVELIRKSEPNTEIIASFFSPSGYNNLKDKLYYDFKVYLPLDFKTRVKRFIEHLKPDIVIVVRYDLWYNFVRYLNKNEIPVHLINATYTISKSLGKKFLGVKFYKMLLKRLSGIYCVNEYHKSKFESININVPIQLVHDTRYDRIISRVEIASKNELLNIVDNHSVLVVGSSWKMDIRLLSDVIKKIKKKHNLIVIYVPHEIDEKTIEHLRNRIGDHYLYSDIIKNQLIDKDLIINEIGLLLDLYKFADIAYVGGAFGSGVHSVTEPAGYGVPIFCGNQHYKNSEDARRLVEIGGLFPMGSTKLFYDKLKELLEDENERKKIGLINKEFVYSHGGSSQIVYNNLIKSL
jgi:3-deoxy-D-manno-octulosonic-acid transferase